MRKMATAFKTAMETDMNAWYKLKEAAEDFVNKCDRGEARSVRSYARFSNALTDIKALSTPGWQDMDSEPTGTYILYRRRKANNQFRVWAAFGKSDPLGGATQWMYIPDE
jgi:hypothetical protein